MKRDARVYASSCLVCAVTKPTATAAALKPNISKIPFAVVALDHMGPHVRTKKNNANILVIIDLCTRWTVAVPCRDITAKGTLEILEREWCLLYGYPDILIMDNHPSFHSGTFQNRLHQWNVTPRFSAVYLPCANPTERRNQEIKKAPRAVLQGIPYHKNWDEIVPAAGVALRRRRNSSTGWLANQLVLPHPL